MNRHPFDEIETSEVGLKAKFKTELYSLLSSRNGIYMPPIADCNYKFIPQLC